jgi:hypothetical protein
MLKEVEFQSLAVVEANGASSVDSLEEGTTRPPTPMEIFAPVFPENTPAILTYSNLSVSTKTTPPKTLLNNVHGSITGGFWSIMGKRNLTKDS